MAPDISGNYTSNLPDQIDGYDYGTNNYMLDYTANNSDGFSSLFTQTWTPFSNPFGGTSGHPIYTVDILNKIVIPPGYNITIKGMTFKFKARTIDYSSGSAVTSWGARVLVQNVTSTTGPQTGGRLTLTSLGIIPTIFTGDGVCSNGMWEGVEVWGDQTLIQGYFSGITAGKQGWLRMYNGSVISKAYIGALAGKKFYNATTTYVYNTPSYGGGIIQAYSNSKFLNNQYGIYFTPYNIGNNKSIFSSVNFTTNAIFLSADNVKPATMAYLNDIKGIYFKGCTFFNDPLKYPQITTPALYGIRGYHAQFFCKPETFGSMLGCTFDNFNYGIYATFYNNTKTITIDYATFTNNFRGIYLSAAALAPSIVRNHFYIMDYYNSNVNNSAYGLYLNACKQFKVEQNDFTTFGGGTSANNFGIIVSNAGAAYNKIYRNTFSTVWTGVEARLNNCDKIFDINGNQYNHIGLQLRCNQFVTNTIKMADIAATSGCIDYNQGYSGDPAGNQFSHTHLNGFSDYFNYSAAFGARINYVSHADANYKLDGYNSPYPAILPSPTPAYYDPGTDCQSTLNGSHLTIPLEDLNANYKTYLTNLDAQKSIIANGNAPALYNAINDLSMSAGNLKNLLMAKSPYLSDGVLAAYISKTGVPNGILKDVIIANSPLTDALQHQLNSMSLPNGIRNQINTAQIGTSPRKLVEDKILYYRFNIAITGHDIIRYYVNDSTLEFKIDTVITKVKDDQSIDGIAYKKEMLADLYIEKGEYLKADSLITDIEQDPSKQNVAKLKRVNKHLKENNLNIFALQSDVVSKQQVDEVAADNETEGYETAMNILQQVFNENYEEPIDDLVMSSYHSYTPMESLEEAEKLPLTSIFPNPNNGNMQLNYELGEEEIGIVNIMDVAGKLVVTYTLENSKNNLQINANDLNNGVYLYQIIVNGKIVNADKLVIIKN